MLPHREDNRAAIPAAGGGVYSRRLWVWLAMGGIAGPVILVAAEVIAILSLPQYNPIREYMSDIAWSPLGWLQSLGFYLSAVMLGSLAWGFLHIIRGGALWRTGAGIFFLAALCFILVGTFPNNHGLTPETPAQLAHTVSAQIAATAFPAASLLMAREMRRQRRWWWLYPYTVAAAAAGLVLTLVLGVSFLPGIVDWPWVGLGERILLINGFIWLAVMVIWSWRLQRRHLSCLAPPAPG